jgi:uncharacterized protein YjiS (DUF1127 family)
MSLIDSFRTRSGLCYRQATPAGRFPARLSAFSSDLRIPQFCAVGRAAKLYLQDSRSVLREAGQGPAVALSVWHARQHFRKELSRLLSVAPHMIADIGMTVEDAAAEAARPFWRA